MCWQQIAEYELQQVTMETANETETTQSNAAKINTAREWLDINDDDSPESSTDILEIVRRCLKEVKQLKTGCTVKMMTQLTAVAEYVKLRAHLRDHRTPASLRRTDRSPISTPRSTTFEGHRLS